MALVMKDLATKTFTKENITKEKFKVQDDMNGNQVSFMMDNGKMDKKTATAYGKDLKLIVTLDNGRKINHTASENTSGATVINTRANGKPASDTDKEAINLPLVTNT